MQRAGLEVAVIHADAVVLLRNDHVVGGLHEVVIAIDDGVLTVQDGEQGHGRTPGVVVAAVDLLVALAAGHLAGQCIVLLHGHVVGGVLHTGSVEQILVVVQHPEVAAERHGVEVAVVGGQLLDGAVEVGGVPGQHVVQGLEVIQVDQVGVAGDIFDGQHVQISAARQLGGQNGHVIGGAQVHHLDGHILVGSHVAVRHCLPVSGGLLVPDGPLQGHRAGSSFRRSGGASRSSRGSCGGAGRTAAGGQGSSCTAGSGSSQEGTARDLFHQGYPPCIFSAHRPRAGGVFFLKLGYTKMNRI